MKKTWRNAGLIALATGALIYPSILLYRAIAKRMSAGNNEEENEEDITKKFAPTYRGKHKPHHRHAQNGQTDHMQA